MNNEKKYGAKVTTKTEANYKGTTINQKGKDSFITTAEKAQYEVFQNGGLPKETIEQWIRQDLNAIASFVHGILNDPDIFPAVVDLYFKKYQALHTNDKDHESKRTTTGKP